jgi:S-adenosylmethionine:tRNA ribosyltransferase-isomerase
MLTELFDFTLPDGSIALRPVEPRDSARLLVVQENGEIRHHQFRDLPNLLKSSDILSFNDTRVIPARLIAHRPPRMSGGPDVTVEVTLHRRDGEACYRAFAQPARRLRAGDVLTFGHGLEASVRERQAGEVVLAFNRAGLLLDRAIVGVGSMPLPPYIAKLRPPDDQDFSDYQTVYAREEGSVAAPTAGLHFTDGLLDRLAASGIGRVDLTLHVGAGTFLPVSAQDTDQHVMHSEHATVRENVALRLNAARAAGGRIVAVGTTSLRTLESATAADGAVRPFAADTDIFITPGYRFKAVDVLITNFHLPRSTLFMLVCAFMGLETMQRAYAEAIEKGYRFYSYGDACLLFRPR